MITNCLPYSIWISLVISGLIFVVTALKKEWFKDSLGSSGILIIAIIGLIATTFICATRVVDLQQTLMVVKIVHTKNETIALSNDNSMICTFQPQNDTNRISRIVRRDYIGMFGETIKTDYIYAP